MLGKLIKQYIDENGIKQKKVADDSGMKPQALNDVLNERRKIEATEYFNVCKALNVGLDYFANKIEQANKKASA